jgi:hypothetical protein
MLPAYTAGATGAAQAVVVIDTGVQTNHEFLSGNVAASLQACFSNGDESGTTALPEWEIDGVWPRRRRYQQRKLRQWLGKPLQPRHARGWDCRREQYQPRKHRAGERRGQERDPRACSGVHPLR